MVCASRTYLEEKVVRWGIGKGITLQDETSFQKEMLNYLTREELSTAATNCKLLIEDELIENETMVLNNIIFMND